MVTLYFELPTRHALLMHFQDSVTKYALKGFGVGSSRYKRSVIELNHICNEAEIDEGEFQKRILKSLEMDFFHINEKNELGEETVMVPLVDAENWGLRKSNWR